ncbi:RNA polymerase sigma factor [Nesterenkonia ebinurensis]|uniref:RNA polymerase sigma factor n=1 Tax=Nesterenkonia ebinurensis TaxID=2608252 RepID=UPI00123CC05F|nr:sigma-70 family RNA polymerase sigma factor [Nesterenkonia ebinurensis]
MGTAAFEQFYREHYGSILATAHLRLGDYAEAQDITAETFRVIWQRHQDGRSPTVPAAFQTLRNLTGNEYRRRRRSQDLVTKLTSVTSSRPVEDAPADIDLLQAVAELKEADRELLYLAYWADIELKDIAGILELKPGTVRMRLKRLREHLAAKLGEDSDTQTKEATHERH